MKTKFFVLGAALLAAGAAFSGCTSVRTTTDDAIAWVRGALQTNLDASLEKTARASGAAMKDLKFTSIVSKQDALSGRVTARTAKDEEVEVLLTPLGAKQTRVDVRVGLISDQTAAMEVLSAIRKRL